MNLFATINHAVHLASVIFWIGGLAFQVLIIAPFAKSDHLPQDYLAALSNRFRRCVGPLLLILMVTGGMNIGFRRAGGELPPGYLSALGLKVLLVTAVASLHLFEMMLSGRSESPPDAPLSHSVWPPWSARWSFLIGVIIIFMAAMLRHWSS